jgi:hypothetical protein
VRTHPDGSSAIAAVMCVAMTLTAACASSVPGSARAPETTTRATVAASDGLFREGQPWTNDVADAPVSGRSDAIIAALNRLGGWGNDGVFQVDFSIPVLIADASAPRREVVGTDDYCFGGPDCDDVPALVPVPDGAHMEGSSDLRCDISAEDCHLLVADRDEQKLFEIYQGTEMASAIMARGLFVWDLNEVHPETLRGDQCTSADAAGFPIAGLTPTVEEVAAGRVDHALRFILPNDRMKADTYVRPATHAGGPESSDPDAPPYGARFRLERDFDESGYGESERVILRALKQKGMFLSDGGEIALTFADDRNSAVKWADLGIDSQSFSAISPDSFEVVGLGDEIPLTYDCVRNP